MYLLEVTHRSIIALRFIKGLDPHGWQKGANIKIRIHFVVVGETCVKRPALNLAFSPNLFLYTFRLFLPSILRIDSSDVSCRLARVFSETGTLFWT